MTKKTRTTFFLIIVGVFILITPIIILYVQGYRFDFEEFSFFRTGGIFLKTEPKQARISINGESLRKKTPLLINGLLPKNFNLKIEKDEFYPWTKQLKVESGLITEAKNIILIPKNLEKNIIFDSTDNIKALPNKNYFLNTREGYLDLVGKNGVYSINLDAYFDNIAVKNKFISTLNSDNIVWNEKDKKLIAYANQDNYLINFPGQTITKFSVKNTDLKESMADGFINLKQVQWHPIENNLITFVYQSDIYSYDLRTNESKIIIKNGLYYKAVSSTLTSNLYYINDMGFINRYNFTTKNIEKISKMPLFYNESVEFLISPDQKKISFWDKSNKKVYVIYGDEMTVMENINFAEFSSDSKKIVYGNSNKVWVKFLENDNEHPKKRQGAIEEIVGSDNQNIVGASWYNQTNQHLWILASDLYFTELDDRPTRNTYTVLKNIPKNTFVNNNEIYVVENNEFNFIDIKK